MMFQFKDKDEENDMKDFTVKDDWGLAWSEEVYKDKDDELFQSIFEYEKDEKDEPKDEPKYESKDDPKDGPINELESEPKDAQKDHPGHGYNTQNNTGNGDKDGGKNSTYVLNLNISQITLIAVSLIAAFAAVAIFTNPNAMKALAAGLAEYTKAMQKKKEDKKTKTKTKTNK